MRGTKCEAQGLKFSSDQGGTKLRGQLSQGLRYYGSAAKDGHEVAVAEPAGNDVDVQVPDNARAGDAAEVETNVESVGLHHLRQRVDSTARELPQVSEFAVGQPVQVGRLFVGHDQ